MKLLVVWFVIAALIAGTEGYAVGYIGIVRDSIPSYEAAVSGQ